jgi:hypothetical protein
MKNMVLVLSGIFLMFTTSAAYPSSEKSVHISRKTKEGQQWTEEEDQLLENLVEQEGIDSWNKVALQMPGRKGKQCRERWLNVIHPSINHAPWTKEEDDFIIAFVEKNGHKWSQCAQELSGRTDNGIKNRWHVLLRQQKKIEKRQMIRDKTEKKLTKNDVKNSESIRQETSEFILDLDYIPSDEEMFEFISNDQHSENLSTGSVDEKNPSLFGERTRKYWQESEDELLLDTIWRYGAENWKQIANEVPGRTAKQCRERWIEQLDPILKHDDWTEEEDQLLIEQHQLLGNKWAEIAQNFPNRTDNQIKNRWYTHLSFSAEAMGEK